MWRFRIIDECNARCFFCHGEGAKLKRKNIKLSSEFIKSFVEKNIDKSEYIAITGGEPLLHPEVISIINIIDAKVGSNFHLNTNGLLLHQHINSLCEHSKLKHIHINLSTLDQITYKKIYGVDLPVDFYDHLDFAVDNGISVTINCVIICNVNDDIDIIKQMVVFCQTRKYNLQFIEDYRSANLDYSKGLIFQLRFEEILTKMKYSLTDISPGRKTYVYEEHKVIIAAPCSPHMAWNSESKSNAFVLTEDMNIERFYNK